MMNPSNHVMLNGVLTDREQTPGSDRLRGTGLFETLTLCEGRLVHQEGHMARMAHSQIALGYSLPPGFRQVAEHSIALANHLEMASCVVRWTLFVTTGSETSLLIQCRHFPSNLSTRREGMHGVTTTLERSMAQHKSLHHEQVERVQLEADTQGNTPAEAILCAADGHILEGSRSNLFVERQGAFFTPPTDGMILPGVTRAHLMTHLRSKGISCEEQKLLKSDLHEADGVFLTGSVLGCAPLITLDGEALSRSDHPELADFWQRETRLS